MNAVRRGLTARAAAALVQDGASVMIGGFLGVGSPHRMIAALVDRRHEGAPSSRTTPRAPATGSGA